MNRRELLRGALAGTVALSVPSLLRGQAVSSVSMLTDKTAVLVVGGTNVVGFYTGNGVVLVDSGAGKTSDLLDALKIFAGNLKVSGDNVKVTTAFNTHYHLDHTANNEYLTGLGAKIIAHDVTRQWMSTDYWVPSEERYEKARPKAAWPTETFFNTGSLKAGAEQIDYGYLVSAHTNGDMYVHFKDSNILAVGDIASPVKDPELDWPTGGWIGGRVDAMDLLLKISNEQTKFIPGTGPVMTRAEFKAEREVMEVVRQRLFKQVMAGEGPQDMLEGGVMKGLARTWKDPYKFLYAACKGCWGNNNKLDQSVV